MKQRPNMAHKVDLELSTHVLNKMPGPKPS